MISLQKEELSKEGVVDMDSGLAFPKTMNSLNAYFG